MEDILADGTESKRRFFKDIAPSLIMLQLILGIKALFIKLMIKSNPYWHDLPFTLNIVRFCTFVQINWKFDELFSDSDFQDLVPKGTSSLLVQPVLQASIDNATGLQKPVGFILLSSTLRYAFSIKDRAWIAAVANKLRGKGISQHNFSWWIYTSYFNCQVIVNCIVA